MKTLASALGLMMSFVLVAGPVSAQVVGIEAVVNEEIVSALDVENRLRFTLMTANLPDNNQTRRRLKPQVVATLVDETLQMQEAQRLSITVEDAEIADAKRILEDQNGLPSGSLSNFLRARNLEESTLLSKIRAEIAWGKLVRRRILSQIDISDEEVDEVYARIQSQRGTQQRLVSEIFLAVDSPDETENVRQLAQRLVRQMRDGSPFAAVAQQFSHGVTSRLGGDIGWIGEGELPVNLEQALRGLSTGQISDPIPTPGGFYILHLRDQRRLGETSPLDAIVSLKQIFIPLTAATSEQVAVERTADARRISDEISGCDAFDTYGRTLESAESGDLGTVRLGDVPQQIRDAIASLQIGAASQPIRMQEGIRILMICDRQEPVAALPDRQAIRDRLGRQRLDMMARRYLRDLRNDAVIESR